MLLSKILQTLVSCLIFIVISPAWSTSYKIPASGDLVGEVQITTPRVGETLGDVGIRYDIGYYEMVRANPKLDPIRPLTAKSQVLVPSVFILPQVARDGLVVNLAEYRLYYFPPGKQLVITMPVGIGKEGWTTPLGTTKVTHKEKEPIWRPTDNVRAEAAKNGTPIPNKFPPGDGNPLGRHVLRLGWPTYLIHGTNLRDGVGSRVSAGCIRMMPEDIADLFEMVPVGTPVRVINEPAKIGRSSDGIYMQVRPLLIEQKDSNLNQLVREKLSKLDPKLINHQVVKDELAYPSGIPRKITM